jgi:murine toxin
MEPDRPDSFIDMVEGLLAGMPEGLRHVSENNQVRIIDTPHVWGATMDPQGVSGPASAAVKDLATLIRTMIGRARGVVDIASLNPPDGPFLEAVLEGLRQCASTGVTVRVRFLFGYVPTMDKVTSFISELARFCRDPAMKRMEIQVGQCWVVRGGASWNHAKIVAVDGREALVGGHNLWWEAYGTYPPVHDISIHVVGDAAVGAHGFVDFIWSRGGNFLVVKKVLAGKISSVKGNRSIRPIEIEMVEWGEQERKTEKSAPDVEDSEEKEEKEEEGSDDELVAVTRDRGRRSAGYRSGRLMALGRAGRLNDEKWNASDHAKEFIITHARTSLKICQQDLAFQGSRDRHRTCEWIVTALAMNPELQVQIVVSPLDGSGGGQQYSWGSGAVGTYALLREMIEKGGSSAQAASMLKRLQVAPFCFTKVTFSTEGVDYHWPEVPKAKHVRRFSESVPLPTPLAGPRIPAPGNHAKVFIADDRVYYIGSDNLYPHNLIEFGYLVEGPSVEDLLKNYWQRVWKYSAPHCVTDTSLHPLVAQRSGSKEEKEEEKKKEFAED